MQTVGQQMLIPVEQRHHQGHRHKLNSLCGQSTEELPPDLLDHPGATVFLTHALGGKLRDTLRSNPVKERLPVRIQVIAGGLVSIPVAPCVTQGTEAGKPQFGIVPKRSQYTDRVLG